VATVDFNEFRFISGARERVANRPARNSADAVSPN